MSILKIKHDGDCMHFRCTGRLDGNRDHSLECPHVVLMMGDGDVDAFCAQHVSLITNGYQYEDGRLFQFLSGAYDGRTASSSDVSPASRRWLAEELVWHEKMRTPK